MTGSTSTTNAPREEPAAPTLEEGGNCWCQEQASRFADLAIESAESGDATSVYTDRLRSRLLAELSADESVPVVLTGDFNVRFGSTALRPLFDTGFVQRPLRSFPTWWVGALAGS
jgi:hypothetical protein